MNDSNIITLKRRPIKNVDYELEELYHSSFFEIAMNSRSQFNVSQYEIILNSLTPILSLKFYQQNPQKALELLNQYKKIKQDEIEFIEKMPDKESCLDHVFKYYFKQFQVDKKEKGFDEALDKNQDFYFLCEDLFRSLPASFVFSLINIMECLKK